MTLLLQVSDPHFGTERPAVVAALEALVQAQRPDVLLLTGDITQRATRAQFAAARAFVDRLQVPAWLAVPGNHDIPLFNLPARLLRPYGGFVRAFGPELEPTFENDAVLVLGLNTTRPWRHVDGELSAEQIERVAQRAAQAARAKPHQLRLVLVHQPLAVTRPDEARNLLHGHAAALQRWAAAGVHAVLGGHIHLPYVVQATAAPQPPLWVVQAGTALSHRVRPEAGNSVNLIRMAAEPGATPHWQVERWDHLPSTQRFDRVSVHPLAA
jgi:3',5'-cyclic AMP phosphodiesterase CpdA